MMQEATKPLMLTISILASNRKDTIPKCLESLRPLLDNVDSELIITDTGCDADLVEFMRQYTENIVKFQWCNDFAAARNIGLKMAKGKWFMFIDDDEWFEDVSEIIDFFNSGEEDRYEEANYIVRNYHSLDGYTYTEGVVGRMFRVHSDSIFKGKVHEIVEHKEGEVKQLLSYAHHYGYAFKSKDQEKKHFERNSSLLKQEIEENPTCARHYAHIYQEYRMVDEPDTILDYAMRSLQYVDYSDRINKINMCSTYVAVLWAYTRKGEFENVIKYGEEFVDNKPITGLTKATLISYMTEAYVRCENYEKALEYVDLYIGLKHFYSRERIRYYKEVGPMIGEAFDDKRMGIALNMGIYAAIKLGELGKVMAYMLEYNWAEHIYMPESECLSWMVDLLANGSSEELKKNKRPIERVLGKIFTHIQCSNIFLGRLTSLKDENYEGYMKVYALMSSVAGQPAYKSFVEFVQVCKKNNYDELINIYRKIVANEEYIFMMEKEFYEVAFKNNIPLGKMFCDLDVCQWQERLKIWGNVARNKELVGAKQYMDIILPKDSLHMQLLEKQLVEILNSRKK